MRRDKSANFCQTGTMNKWEQMSNSKKCVFCDSFQLTVIIISFNQASFVFILPNLNLNLV